VKIAPGSLPFNPALHVVTGAAWVVQGRTFPQIYLEYLVILRFERRNLKQNTVASLKSKICPPQNLCPHQIFGLVTPLHVVGKKCMNKAR